MSISVERARSKDDNSFGESRGNASNVWIDIDRRKRVITLIDDEQGVEDVSALFTLGKRTREAGSDIGRYRMGGSEALLWLGRVRSCRGSFVNGQVPRDPLAPLPAPLAWL